MTAIVSEVLAVELHLYSAPPCSLCQIWPWQERRLQLGHVLNSSFGLHHISTSIPPVIELSVEPGGFRETCGSELRPKFYHEPSIRRLLSHAAMPLYELFCMARPALARPDAAQVIRNVAAAVLSKDGILTDIKSYGDHPLAYTICRPGQRYEEAFMWQVDFAAAPSVLEELKHLLKVDDRIIRYVVLKREPFKPLPTTYRIARIADRRMAGLQQ